MTSQADAPPKTSNELALERTTLADERTDLAVIRTLQALDRTLMAWVRTATSLISFGFTIYKVFQQLAQSTSAPPHRLLEPRGVALVLMGLGVGGLIAATIDYRRQRKAMQERFHSYGPFLRSPASGVATIICGLGILGFVLVVLRQ
jgi:putative membrane protein